MGSPGRRPRDKARTASDVFGGHRGQTGGQRHRAFDEGSRPALSICPPLASSTGPGTGHSLPSSPTAFRASGRQGRGQGCPFHPCSRVAGLAVGPEALRPEPVHRPANRSSGRKTPLQGEGPQREAEWPRGWGHRALSEKHMAEGPFWSCETRVGSVGQPRCPDGGAGLGAPVLALGGAAGPEGAHCRDPVTPGLRPVRPTLSSPPHCTQTPVLTAHLLNAITSPGQPCEADPNTHPQPDAKTGAQRGRATVLELSQRVIAVVLHLSLFIPAEKVFRFPWRRAISQT